MPLHHMFMPTPLLASSLLLSGASASLVYVPAIFVRDLFTTPYNVSSTPGELGLVAVKGNLLERQSCAPGWASCTAAFGCCIAGDNCCSNGGVLLGCCRAGSQCGVNNVGQLVCNAVGGGGTDSCADQGRVPCSHVNNACCPVGTDCTTVNNNIVCAPINSVPPTPQPSPAPTSVLSASFSTTTTEPDSSSSTSSTSNTIISTSTGLGPQPSPSIDQAELSQLLECQPCGSSQCSFSSAQNLADTTYDVLVGSAVTNCNGGSTSIKSTIGGSLTVGSSWSIGSTIGAELGVLKLEAQYTYGQQQSVQLSQTLEIEIEPGKQGALVATVLYNRTGGSMKVGSRAAFPLVLNQPGSNTYSQQIIPCGQKFTANVVSPQKCASGARGVMGLVPSIAVLAAIAVAMPIW